MFVVFCCCQLRCHSQISTSTIELLLLKFVSVMHSSHIALFCFVFVSKGFCVDCHTSVWKCVKCQYTSYASDVSRTIMRWPNATIPKSMSTFGGSSLEETLSRISITTPIAKLTDWLSGCEVMMLKNWNVWLMVDCFTVGFHVSFSGATSNAVSPIFLI